MVTRQEIRFDQLTQYGSPVPADAEVLVTVGDVQYRVALSQLPRGTDVEANPTDPATDTLTSIEIEGVVYSVSVTPADDSITPAMLDADTNAKKLAMRTRIGAGTLEPADIAGLQLMQFAGVDGDTVPTVDDSAIGLYVGNSVYTSGDIAEATFIYVADGMTIHGQDPSNPNTDLDAYTLPVLKGAGYAVTLTEQGQNASVLFFTGIPVRVANGWRLPVVSTWGSYTPSSAGSNWNVAMLQAYVPSLAQHREALPDGDDNSPAQTTTFLTGAFKKLSVTAFVTLLEGLSASLLARVRRLVQGNNETITLRVKRVNGTPAAAGEFSLDGLSDGVGQVLLYPPTTEKGGSPITVGEIKEFQSGDFVDYNGIEWELGATPWDTFAGNVVQASMQLAPGYTYDANDLPAVNAFADLELEGRDIHLGLVVRQILKRVGVNLGGKGGTQGQYWRRNATDSDAGWGDLPDHTDAENTVPFAAAFRDTYSRTWGSILNNATNGEAIISNGNTVPQGAPAGTTDFLGMDWNNTAGTSEKTALAKVAVGDWMRGKSGDKYVIAKIQHINESVGGSNYEFWFNPSTAIDETLQYDTLPNGAGEVRFYRQGGDAGPAATLSDDTPAALGTAAAGTGTEASRDDHVHPAPTAVKGWQGVRRRLGAKLTDSISSSDTWNNLFTVSITPDAVGQKLRLRYHILMSREQGGSNLLGLAARKVIGSWDGGIFDTTADTRDFSPLELRQWAQSNAWLDWLIEAWNGEYEFTAESTDTVKINIGAFCLNQADPVVRENGTLYINRAQNLPASNWPGADANYFSWVELTKFGDGNEDVTETVITALDGA